MKTRVIAVVLVFLAVSRYANSRPASGPQLGRPLPDALVSALASVKAGTSIPILLPTELPQPFSGAEHAVVEKAKVDEYAVVLYYELGVGNSGFAVAFGAKDKAPYSPRELPNVQEVKLSRGILGFFRPVSCGGSCAPANLWWEQGAVLYHIQLQFPSALREEKQQRTITKVANSAILAGPR